MQANELETYLTELGQELEQQNIVGPIRVLMVGGAYMILLTKMNNRITDDIDIVFLTEDWELKWRLIESVHAIAERHQETLSKKWFNSDVTRLLWSLGDIPEGKTWKSYGPIEVCIPDAEYILALKLCTTREKDLTDAKHLCKRLGIDSTEQVRAIVLKYMRSPEKLHEICDLEANLHDLSLSS